MSSTTRTDEEIELARKDEMCRCTHGRRGHYKGIGMCSCLGGGGHICICNRFRHLDKRANLALRKQKLSAGERTEEL